MSMSAGLWSSYADSPELGSDEFQMACDNFWDDGSECHSSVERQSSFVNSVRKSCIRQRKTFSAWNRPTMSQIMGLRLGNVTP